MRRLLLALSSLSALGLAATAAPASAQSATESLTFDFATYAAGLNVVNFEGSFSADSRQYRLDLVYHTSGIFGAVIHSDMDTRVNGIWTDNTVSPLQFYSWGHIRGVARRTLIEYANGQPEIRDLQPPNEQEREPVPVASQRNTVDSLSAIALLMRHVADTGRCDGAITTFDGRRLARITVATGGQDMLTASHGSHFAGPALRCDFVGQQLAGFRRDDDPDVVRRPHRGSAWFARLSPGAMPVPVRLSFRTQWFGDAVAYLTKVTQNGSLQ
jgi:hypothetical protein